MRSFPKKRTYLTFILKYLIHSLVSSDIYYVEYHQCSVYGSFKIMNTKVKTVSFYYHDSAFKQNIGRVKL